MINKINSSSHLHDCTFKTIFKFYLNFNFPFVQNLILAKCFNPFLHFLFLIKSTKKFIFQPELKNQKIKLELVCESSFLYFWQKK